MAVEEDEERAKTENAINIPAKEETVRQEKPWTKNFSRDRHEFITKILVPSLHGAVRGSKIQDKMSSNV